MKRHVYLLPIEPIPNRYSDEWRRWFINALISQRIEYTIVKPGSFATTHINNDRFFANPVAATMYRAGQIATLSNLLPNADKDELPVVFLMDAWFPGIEAITFMRDVAKIDMRIVGMFHGGLWDPCDCMHYVSMKLKSWAFQFEEMAFRCLDMVLLGSQHHFKMIAGGHHSRTYFDVEKCRIVPLPVLEPVNVDWKLKSNLVLWPHRLSPEKDHDKFKLIERLFRQKYPGLKADFVTTREVAPSKETYHALLAMAKVVVSTSMQETFGISMLEGANYGCAPIAPRALSYPELLEDRFLYDQIEEAVDLIATYLLTDANPAKYAGSTKLNWLKEVVETC